MSLLENYREDLRKKFNKLEKAYEAYEAELEKVEKKVRLVCDFEARIVFCAGDRHLVINEETANVATLSCLVGKSIKNKLTAEEHKDFCI